MIPLFALLSNIAFSQDYNIHIILQHKDAGEKAVYLKENTIYIFDGKEEVPVIHVENIPATFCGALEHNIENSLAAVSASYAIGIDSRIISKGLSKFHTDAANNIGRFNVFEVADFKVIIDYGHNIGGYSRVLNGLKKMKMNRLIGVIGVPGDRTDISILKVGELSGRYFDQVYIKEDQDLRGRKRGEVADLLKKGCTLGKLVDQQISIVLDEKEALIKAMENAKAGDTIIVFYEAYQHLVDAIKDFRVQIESSIVANEMPAVAGKV